MYILKQIPEDFVVTEISNVKILGQGKYLYLNLKKTNRNTLDCVKEIAKQLNLKEKDVGFAGSKDKNAVTTQLVSVLGVSKEKISKIKIDNCELSILGSGNKPISLGDLEGNSFEITIRDLEEVNINKTNFVANYFDEQRFSVHNVDIGRHLVKKEFKEAV
ncbi:tRNA pseudouridine(13) synthase TruD, partial [Candidatus Woesearchaeota archaeon]|nr:tRNA pseudouridine(13) synthase TruD [Candidatus Woesearchaeota archaeon]